MTLQEHEIVVWHIGVIEATLETRFSVLGQVQGLYAPEWQTLVLDQ